MQSIGKLVTGISNQPTVLCWSPDSKQLAVNHPHAYLSIYTIRDDLSALNSTPSVLLETGIAAEIRWLDID